MSLYVCICVCVWVCVCICVCMYVYVYCKGSATAADRWTQRPGEQEAAKMLKTTLFAWFWAAGMPKTVQFAWFWATNVSKTRLFEGLATESFRSRQPVKLPMRAVVPNQICSHRPGQLPKLPKPPKLPKLQKLPKLPKLQKLQKPPKPGSGVTQIYWSIFVHVVVHVPG